MRKGLAPANNTWTGPRAQRPRRLFVLVNFLPMTVVVLACSLYAFSEQVVQDRSEDYGSLVITWAGVVDNGEGDDPPHGPIGSLHVLVYEADVSDPGDRFAYDAPLAHVYLSGPTSGGGTKQEWLDGDEKEFENLELFQWRGPDDAVSVLIYESDPSSLTFNFLDAEFRVEMKRRHDRLFYAMVSRPDTLSSPMTLSSGAVRPASADALQNVKGRASSRWIQRVYRPKEREDMPWHDAVFSLPVPAMFVTFATVGPDTPTAKNYR